MPCRTQLTRRLSGAPASPRPRHGTAPRFTYIRYDTSEPQGRQVAHKTKETRGRNGRRGRARDSDGERSGGEGEGGPAG